MKLKGQHLLSVKDLSLDLINELFTVAESMRPYAERQKVTRVLEGAVLGNMFFEPSTRTRVSFGCAFNLLGGEVRETTGLSNSALAKGESLYDTAQVLSGYSDIIAMRHPQPGSVAEFAQGSRVPVINGGDGANEHPTQALLDLFTIHNELASQGKNVQQLSLTLLGDLKHGRTVHSLCQLLGLYRGLKIQLISPEALTMPTKYVDILTNAGHEVEIGTSLEQGLPQANVIYQTRIQEERFSSQEEANRYRGYFRLNKKIYSEHCQPNAVIMHPLPRDSRNDANELDNDLNAEPGLAIFRQTDNGILVRMALFACILGVENQLHQYERSVNWHVGLNNKAK
ncbi:aspartate carbamoyltransferase [Aliikangiella coralliicola]|uniref:Aspartate carbamoyltransferase n=1 Tax=Aliikangiella coralliicola TaxID=2592383 RepID=A0A545U760_9GAMM|nr:aspartate carbamoyltransferase [Aliikangiella coralliicola]TQV85284.1 aspartate carbamoyltransferase [Aliikangiella coralliicola]